jgi:hypothetical protein
VINQNATRKMDDFFVNVGIPRVDLIDVDPKNLYTSCIPCALDLWERLVVKGEKRLENNLLHEGKRTESPKMTFSIEWRT